MFEQVFAFERNALLEDRLWSLLSALHILSVLRSSAECVRRCWRIVTAVDGAVGRVGGSIRSALALDDSDNDRLASCVAYGRAALGRARSVAFWLVAVLRTGAVELLIR